MYCVRYKSTECGVGYIRPWNSVRDGETYSLTYLIPSFIDGVAEELGCKGKILRHKLRFKGMDKELFKSPEIIKNAKVVKNGNDKKVYRDAAISTIHQLLNPEIILGFEKMEDAKFAATQTIYVGQTQYPIYPVPFDDIDQELDVDGMDNLAIKELSGEEFDKLRGTETVQVDENSGVYCGNNRFRNNERMYIKIIRV